MSPVEFGDDQHVAGERACSTYERLTFGSWRSGARSTPVSRLSGNSRVRGRGSRERVKCRDCGWDVLVGWCRRFTASGEPFDPLGVLCP